MAESHYFIQTNVNKSLLSYKKNRIAIYYSLYDIVSVEVHIIK